MAAWFPSFPSHLNSTIEGREAIIACLTAGFANHFLALESVRSPTASSAKEKFNYAVLDVCFSDEQNELFNPDTPVLLFTGFLDGSLRAKVSVNCGLCQLFDGNEMILIERRQRTVILNALSWKAEVIASIRRPLSET